MGANVVLCHDTRKLSPEQARKVWWEISIGRSPTTSHAQHMGWGPVCFVVSGMVFADADKLPGVLELCDLRKTCRTEAHALELVAEHAQRLIAIPRLCGPTAAMAERQRVWRVDGR